MAEATARALPLALRAVQVRAAAAVASGRATSTDREELEQEAILTLLRVIGRFDASRASLRTFVERVADTRFASMLRRRRSTVVMENLDGLGLTSADGIPAVQFRVDFERVLAPLAQPDREMALLLIDHGPAEISRMLGVARSTVYGRIARLRQAFHEAGYGPARGRR